MAKEMPDNQKGSLSNEEEKRPVASKRVWLLSLGYGLSALLYCGTIPGIAFLLGVTDSWKTVILMQMVIFATVGLGRSIMRRTWRTNSHLGFVIVSVMSAFLVVGSLLVCYLCAHPTTPMSIALGMAVVLGLAGSCPLAFFSEMASHIYGEYGRQAGVMLLLFAVLIASIVPLMLIPLVERTSLLFVAIAIITVCSTVIQIIVLNKSNLFRSFATSSPASPVKPSGSSSVDGGAQREAQHAHAASGHRYRLTRYSIVSMASMGAVMGIISALLIFFFCQEMASVWSWGSLAAPAVFTLLVIVAYGVHANLCGTRLRGIRFGLINRVLLACTIVAFCLTPVMLVHASHVMLGILRALFMAYGFAVILFSIQIANQTGHSLFSVFPTNYLPYSLGACGGCLAALASLSLGDLRLALELIAVLASCVTAPVIPFLPSTSSNAIAFTHAELPENEDSEQRLRRVGDQMVATYQLSNREAEVLGLLMRGLSREQIAQKLDLSSWTIKDHMSSIYSKVGVHSYQDLLALVQKELSEGGGAQEP